MTDVEIAVILRRLDEQDKALARIESKVDKTNGRVTKLEGDKRIAEAIAKDHAHDWEWVKTLVITVIAALVTGVGGSVVAIIAGVHP
jgi:hypothetical protein